MRRFFQAFFGIGITIAFNNLKSAIIMVSAHEQINLDLLKWAIVIHVNYLLAQNYLIAQNWQDLIYNNYLEKSFVWVVFQYFELQMLQEFDSATSHEGKFSICGEQKI